jgi:hypothetical protein
MESQRIRKRDPSSLDTHQGLSYESQENRLCQLLELDTGGQTVHGAAQD